MSSREIAEKRAVVNYRDAETPAVVAACKNCAEYRSDQDERMGMKGSYMERTNSRCILHKFPVKRNAVCDRHMFMHTDRRDA